ncbi:MAG: tagaturonate epimerase family protein [Bryobacteraceae bacterium]|jgi:hypothetical protein
MPDCIRLARYSIGIGDRFAHQAEAQLRACCLAAERGVEVTPVWNKSNREHLFIGSHPAAVRAAADAAVAKMGWNKPYFADADHINLDTVDRFLDPCDFFTIDVAHFIGLAPSPAEVERFVSRHPELTGDLRIEGIGELLTMTRESSSAAASKYLVAVSEAGRIYRHIKARKPAPFITEVSMDETDAPQTPPELLVILALLADENVPIQTIAPKFTGRFNKGVDYVGDVRQFEKEFERDVAVVSYAVERYDLPRDLKLSIHSGSDKFSIYAPVRRVLERSGAGVHLKTAGTTWLEELIGLAEAGGEGLELAGEIYARAYEKREKLCEPYAAVIDIDFPKLPLPAEVAKWSSDEYVAALRHDPKCPKFDPNVRQLLHVGFKIAAGLGEDYTRTLEKFEAVIAPNVTGNLFDRHIRPLFLSQ